MAGLSNDQVALKLLDLLYAAPEDTRAAELEGVVYFDKEHNAWMVQNNNDSVEIVKYYFLLVHSFIP